MDQLKLFVFVTFILVALSGTKFAGRELVPSRYRGPIVIVDQRGPSCVGELTDCAS